MSSGMVIGDFGKLSAGEAAALKAVCAGEMAVLGTAVPDEATEAVRLRGDFVRYLALGGCAAHPVPERGVHIVRAFVEGEVDLRFGEVRGALGLDRCAAPDGFNLMEARLGFLSLQGSKIGRLFGQGMVVNGSVYLRGEFEATGMVALNSAEIGGQLDCSDGKFLAAEGMALNGQGMAVKVGVFLRDGFEAAGGVNLAAAEIGGQLDCNDGKFLAAEGMALNGQGMFAKGDVFLGDGFEASGAVDLNGARIGDILDLSGGRFEAREGFAFRGRGMVVAGEVRLEREFSAKGEVNFYGAQIGQLRVNEARFEAAYGTALNLAHARIKTSLYWLDAEVAAGEVDLQDCQVETLNDTVETWPDGLRMDGFRYGRLLQGTGVAGRLDWLAKNASTDFKPQPYQQLAKVMGEMGHRGDRAKVLYRMEQGIRAQQRKGMGWLRRQASSAWDLLSRWVVGFGYYPQWALYWGAGLLAAVGLAAQVAWWAGDMTPVAAPVLMSEEWQALAESAARPGVDWSADDGPGRDYETFRSWWYGVDVVVPIINLGQEATWGPSTSRGDLGWWMQVLLPFVKLMGWVVTAMGAAAVTGAIRRD